MNRIWSIPICLCVVALFGIQDSYAYEKAYRVRNNSLNSRRGLYFAIVGTGEMATLEVHENPHGCPIPNVTAMGSSAWIIDWVLTCVPPGESVVVKITTAGSEGNEFSDGHWIPGDVPVEPGDVTSIGLATVSNTNFIYDSVNNHNIYEYDVNNTSTNNAKIKKIVMAVKIGLTTYGAAVYGLAAPWSVALLAGLSYYLDPAGSLTNVGTVLEAEDPNGYIPPDASCQLEITSSGEPGQIEFMIEFDDGSMLRVPTTGPALPLLPPYIICDSLSFVERGVSQAYIPFTICNANISMTHSYGYNITSRGYIGLPIDQSDTITVPGGECEHVYGLIDVVYDDLCNWDTLTIIAWTTEEGPFYDTCACVQMIHVVEPQPVPMFNRATLLFIVLALILSGAFFVRRHAMRRA
jgi:hypothetical protein